MGVSSILTLVFFSIGFQSPTQTKGECDLKPSEARNEWTAQQLVMRVSDGNLCRGFFICNDETKMMKKRRKAIDILDTIQFSGSAMTDSFFSKDFEEESTSKNFMSRVDSFGTKVAVSANANYLFLSAKAGHSVEHNKKHSKEKSSTASRKYFESIKGYNIPIKSIDLDPMYMELNKEVLDELRNNYHNSTETEDQKLHFIDFFEKYGSHFLTGTMELGGTLIAKGKTSIEGSSISEKIKDTVNKATDTYLDISATFVEGGGGVEVKTSANNLKSHLSSSVDEEALKSITLDFEKKGGPPGEDNIAKWKKGLVDNTDTWRIIDKSTELIAVWDIFLLHHKDEFENAEIFASQMKDAWEYIIGLPDVYLESVDSQAMTVIVEEFIELGISPSFADKRKQLLIDMISQGKLGAQMDSRYAHLDVIPSGQVVMSTLQKEPLDKDTSILQFESIMFLLEIPNVVYLKLEHKNTYLGHIIMTLDGYKEYPKRVKQMLELSTGMNSHGGTYRGSTFRGEIQLQGKTGEAIFCDGYMDDNGEIQDVALFPLENGTNTSTPVKAGQLRSLPWQNAGFTIMIRDDPGYVNEDLNLGHVIYGLDVLQAVTNRGSDYLADVTISDSGVVVIDHELAEQTEISERTNIEKIFPVDPLEVFVG